MNKVIGSEVVTIKEGKITQEGIGMNIEYQDRIDMQI
jgi:hypothetical protein